ncbi:hypothetical protein V493_07171 [Pseudogymnoascus sp. VKM F-4281 (FW-2241)]|nr:hypothetical protein V493_07171 [Pseudogymnoascus sp. VKM F-4281 (FW-2241)]
MATRSVSPGGALLRASRMFSVPAPVQRQASELASNATFGSDSATLPHPTHLSISTPPSSRSKGDWGFKRNLPLRSTTKTSTPVIRISSVDTYDHITEFGSAADHTLTLRKWQELNMPLTAPSVAVAGTYGPGNRTPGRGVFETDTDITETGVDAANKDKRWKFEGPWLAGQTEAEFNEYVRTEVAKRRPAFRKFLQNHKADQDTKDAQRKAREAGVEAPEPLKATEMTEEEMTGYLRILRQDRSELFRLIRDFLDLPPSPSVNTDYGSIAESLFTDMTSGSLSGKTVKAEDYIQKSSSPYANTGPPKTHPSAGLSYLRTGAHISNHPVYGPQQDHAPVQGRVILPKNAAVGSFAPKLGVAGVVVDIPTSSDYFNTSTFGHGRKRSNVERLPGLINIEPEKVGGSKVYLSPKSATIDSKGRINLSVTGAQNAAVAVLEGTVSTAAPQSPVDSGRTSFQSAFGRSSGAASSKGYGMSSETDNAFGDRARNIESVRWTQSKRMTAEERRSGKEEFEQLESLLAGKPLRK